MRTPLSRSFLATAAALAREESRGAHYRADFPDTERALDHHHQLIRRSADGVSRQFGPLFQDAPA